MTEQVSLFETPEEAAYKLIEPRLKQIVCTENRLSEDHLKLIKRRFGVVLSHEDLRTIYKNFKADE